MKNISLRQLKWGADSTCKSKSQKLEAKVGPTSFQSSNKKTSFQSSNKKTKEKWVPCPVNIKKYKEVGDIN